MNKNTKLLIKDTLIALAIVLLYSPGLLNLRPWDESIVRASFSVIGLIVLSYCFIKVNILDMKEPERISASEIKQIPDARNALKALGENHIFEEQLQDADRQLMQVEQLKRRISVILNPKFPPGTLSRQKFDGTVDSSVNAIVRNCASLIDRVQLFDEGEYKKIKRLIESGDYKKDNIPDDVQEEKYRLYENNFKAVIGIVGLNERILMKLEAFSAEISGMNDISDGNDKILDEIQNLIEETKYYE
ncbi:MAG: hypothetical protein J6P05_00930 [Lachnospiraceae bacterium]|nr:hypothetical protein [Lachnospiraceae bacterium]